MQALEVLLNRVSVPRLVDPAPNAAQREIMFGAACARRIMASSSRTAS